MPRKQIIIIVISIFFVLSTIVLVVHTKYFSNILLSFNLIPKPETFTQLYFINHAQLPHRISIGQQQVFQFAIHNAEQRGVFYTYEVLLNTGNQNRKIIDNNTVFIQNNAYKIITEDFSLDTIATHAAIIVSLPYKDQQIHFWIRTAE